MVEKPLKMMPKARIEQHDWNLQSWLRLPFVLQDLRDHFSSHSTDRILDDPTAVGMCRMCSLALSWAADSKQTCKLFASFDLCRAHHPKIIQDIDRNATDIYIYYYIILYYTILYYILCILYYYIYYIIYILYYI